MPLINLVISQSIFLCGLKNANRFSMCMTECMVYHSMCVCVCVCVKCLLPVLLARFFTKCFRALGEQIAVKRVHVCGFHIKIDPSPPERFFTAHKNHAMCHDLLTAYKLWNREFCRGQECAGKIWSCHTL